MQCFYMFYSWFYCLLDNIWMVNEKKTVMHSENGCNAKLNEILHSLLPFFIWAANIRTQACVTIDSTCATQKTKTNCCCMLLKWKGRVSRASLTVFLLSVISQQITVRWWDKIWKMFLLLLMWINVLGG